MSDAVKLALVAAGLFLVGIAGFVLFSSLWVRVGLGAAIVVVVGGLLLFAWRKDRKDRELREGLERI